MSRASKRLLGVLACAWMMVFIAGCEEGGVADSDRTPVILFGIDGADWDVINSMIAAGELPQFEKIKDRGAWGELINPGPQNSPAVWTTIATGRFPRQHGILAHTFPYRDVPAKRRVTSELRRVPALWNIADHYGLTSAVVGYFVTQPPERINGVMVSDMSPYHSEGSIYPEGAIDLQSERFTQLREDGALRARLNRRFLGWNYAPEQAEDPASPYYRAARTVQRRQLDRRIFGDEYIARCAMELAKRPADLFITYLRLVDFMSHSLWLYHDAEGLPLKPQPQLSDLFGESVRESYRYADEFLGKIFEVWGDAANIVIVSDHGFGPKPNVEMPHDPTREPLTGNHRPNGIFLAIGPDIAPGEIRGMTIMEVAPMLMVLLGLPVSDQLPGRIETRLFRDGYFEDREIATVRNYDHIEVRGLENRIDRSVEEQSMQTLKGLGYIGDDVELDATAATDQYRFWDASDDEIEHHLHGEVVYYLLRGEIELAEGVWQLLQTHRPDLGESLLDWVNAKFRRLRTELPEYRFDERPVRAFLEKHGKRPRLESMDAAEPTNSPS